MYTCRLPDVEHHRPYTLMTKLKLSEMILIHGIHIFNKLDV